MGEAQATSMAVLDELRRAKDIINGSVSNLTSVSSSMTRCVSRLYEDPETRPAEPPQELLSRLDRIMGAWNISKEVSLALRKTATVEKESQPIKTQPTNAQPLKAQLVAAQPGVLQELKSNQPASRACGRKKKETF